MDYIKEYQRWQSVLGTEALKEFHDNDAEIKEAFFAPLAFGTAGMRGIVGMGIGRMNIYTVGRATVGLAKYVISIGAQERGVAIAYDTRRCSLTFAVQCARILSHYKIKVFLYENVRPVPMISFALRYEKAIAGIMITASHNPKAYNGYKVYGEDGAQMSPEATQQVVDYINKGDYFDVPTAALSIDKDEAIHGMNGEMINQYVKVIGADVDKEYFAAISKLSLSPKEVEAERSKLKIVYTPLHGAGYMPVTTILSQMGIPFSVVEQQAMPDTEFSTVSVPNPEQKDALSMGIALAEKLGSNVVIGTDPDCDRMGVAIKDAQGKFMLLNGNQIGAMLMDYILLRHTQKGTLPTNAAVVKTIVTTSFARKIAESYGATVFDVLTGFKFIGEKIKEWEQSGEYTFMFGYEESYGYLSGTHARDKDAVVASMLFAEMVCYWKNKGVELYDRLQALFAKFGYFRDISNSFTFSGVDGMDKMARIMEKLHGMELWSVDGEEVTAISDYEKRETTLAGGEKQAITLPKTNAIYYSLKGGNWLCVRPSGTEPKLKIYVSISAPSMAQAEKRAAELIDFYKKFFD